jgi:hypothetical protein
LRWLLAALPSSRVVTAPFCHLNNDLLDGLVIVPWVEAVSGAPILSSWKFGGVDVHRDDASGT